MMSVWTWALHCGTEMKEVERVTITNTAINVVANGIHQRTVFWGLITNDHVAWTFQKPETFYRKHLENFHFTGQYTIKLIFYIATESEETGHFVAHYFYIKRQSDSGYSEINSWGTSLSMLMSIVKGLPCMEGVQHAWSSSVQCTG